VSAKYFSHYSFALFESVQKGTAVSTSYRVKYILLFALVNLGAYFLIQNYVIHEYDFLMDIDKSIPFIPEYIWVYHSMMPVIAATMFFTVRSKRLFMTTIISCILASVIINACYALFPSFYPRPEFIPLTLSERLVDLSYNLDSSCNTFPSGHVAFAFLMYLAIRYCRQAKKMPVLKRVYLLWAIGIAFSTLTLKFHYVIDVVGGFAVAMACFYVTKHFIEKKNLYESEESNSEA